VHDEAVAGSLELLDVWDHRWAVEFRVMDDGVAFRTHFHKRTDLDSLTIAEELSAVHLTGNPEAWWIPGDWDSYELLYQHTRLDDIDAFAAWDSTAIISTTVRENAIATPATFRYDGGLHVALHEAALYDYPEITLKRTERGFVTDLVGKAHVELPFSTPWRTITVADDAGGLLESTMALDLNAPQAEDPTGGDWKWARPMKYVGIWWEMHLDKSSWSLWNTDEQGQPIVGNAHGRHGATTENTRKYIDFAAAHGFEGVLVEGWNTGWERWIGFDDREEVFDFVTPYPDYDLRGLAQYAQDQGVQLIAHHETSAAVTTYDAQMDTAYAQMAALGQRAVKTGYVGPIIPRGEHHHGQWMVQHYQRSVETAARHGVAVNIHEPIKDTGIRRTWPNLLSREGARGQEFNAWGRNGGNPMDHNATLAFTRMLAGPMDFTPGVVHLSLDPWRPNNRIPTTLGGQLGLYVVFYSPLQMACDLPEHYEREPLFVDFLEHLAVDWEWTDVLSGEVGEFAVVARQERGGDRVFIGGINAEAPRAISEPLHFLHRVGHEGRWELMLWQDGPDGIVKTKRTVAASDTLELDLAAGGGFAGFAYPAP
jgi:alpha-glucosidase